MSRAYRIRLSERIQRVTHLKDGVSLQLEILDVLPREEMAELIAAALKDRGWQPVDDQPDTLELPPEDGITIRVNVRTGEVIARVEGTTEITIQRDKDARVASPQDGDKAREALVQSMEKEADEHAESVRRELSEKLEQRLAEVRPQLDRAVNEATANALKKRAAQLGEVESIEEDPDSGRVVIKVKV